MEDINNNLFDQVPSETSATVSGGSYGDYGYYHKGANLSFNYDNYLLALGVFYQNAPDVAKTLNVFGTDGAFIGTAITHTNGITAEESLAASKLGFSSGGWW